MIASYPVPVCDGEKVLPPTLIESLWHGGFTARSRNPFTCCFFKHRCCYDGCEYLKHFGGSREEQVRNYDETRRVVEEINKAKDGKLEIVTFRIPVDMLDAVNRYVAELKTTRSAVIRHAIAQMLEKMRKVAEEQAAQVVL